MGCLLLSQNDPSGEVPKLGCTKTLAFFVVTLVSLLVCIELTWRLVCAVGLMLPPCGDQSLAQEWEWVEEHREGDIQIFGDALFRFDPGLGWALKGNYHSDGINTNVHGQRGLVDWPVERQPGKKRILIIGDSYTFGFQVRDEETYPQILLTRFLPKYEVINWGVPGYGTDQQVLLYEREGKIFQPDLVILGFFTRDVFRNDTWFRSYAKPVFELRENEVVLAQHEIPSPTELVRIYESGEKKIGPKGLFLTEYLKRLRVKLDRRSLDENSPEWRITAGILERFLRSAERYGTQAFLLIIPNEEILQKDRSATHDTVRLLSAECGRLGMPYLDLTPAFREKSKTDSRPLYQGHFTPWGDEVTAEALYNELKRTGLI